MAPNKPISVADLNRSQNELVVIDSDQDGVVGEQDIAIPLNKAGQTLWRDPVSYKDPLFQKVLEGYQSGQIAHRSSDQRPTGEVNVLVSPTAADRMSQCGVTLLGDHSKMLNRDGSKFFEMTGSDALGWHNENVILYSTVALDNYPNFVFALTEETGGEVKIYALDLERFEFQDFFPKKTE